MSSTIKTPLIALLPGDGIGPEVLPQAHRALEFLSDRFQLGLRFESGLLGGVAIEESGTPLPQETLDLAHRSTAVLAGAVGGPQWDHLPAESNPGLGGMLRLRKAFDLFANLRPITGQQLAYGGADRDVDVLLVREAVSGAYFSEPRGREASPEGQAAFDTIRYTEAEIRRVVRLAASFALERRGRLTSIDKANVLESSRLWREIATDELSGFSDLEIEHMYVDNAAYQLALDSSRFDVLVTENMFGDILSDQLAGVVGSLGLLPSAGLGNESWGLYEPVHGSAPDIAGQGIANPIAAIRSAALLLRHSIGHPESAHLLEQSCTEVLVELGLPHRNPQTTASPGPSTVEIGDLVLSRLGNTRLLRE